MLLYQDLLDLSFSKKKLNYKELFETMIIPYLQDNQTSFLNNSIDKNVLQEVTNSITSVSHCDISINIDVLQQNEIEVNTEIINKKNETF